MANAALGKVYAPDPDDWDNKTYTLETSASKYGLTAECEFLAFLLYSDV